MSLKRILFLVLILLLPADGTDYLRVEIRGVGVSILDLLLVAVLYLDLIDGSLAGFQAPRFTRWTSGLALLAACLSAVSLLYVPPYRISSDVKVTLNLLQLALTVYLAARIFRTRPEIRGALRVLVASVAVVGLATVGKSLGLDIPGDARTAAVTFGGLTFGVSGLTQIPGPISLVLLAAFPAVALPALLRSPPLRAALASLLLLAAAVTFSRSLWLALAMEVLVLLWLGALTPGREGAGGRRRRYAARLALAAAAAALPWAGPRLFDLLVALRPTTVSGRLAGFADAWQVATQSPVTFLFGAGKGTYRLWTGAGTVPHNAVLDLLVAKGALAVIVFLALQVWVMARLWRRLRGPEEETAVLARALLTGLAGLLAFGLVSPTMTSLVLWVVIGLATAFVSIEEARPPSGGCRRGAGSNLGVGAGVRRGVRTDRAVGDAPTPRGWRERARRRTPSPPAPFSTAASSTPATDDAHPSRRSVEGRHPAGLDEQAGRSVRHPCGSARTGVPPPPVTPRARPNRGVLRAVHRPRSGHHRFSADNESAEVPASSTRTSLGPTVTYAKFGDSGPSRHPRGSASVSPRPPRTSTLFPEPDTAARPSRRGGLEGRPGVPGSRGSQVASERLRDAELIARLPPPKHRQKGLDLESLADAQEGTVELLDGLAKGIKSMRKQADESVIAKREAQERHRRIYANVARIQEGLYRLAGLDELAERIRATVPKKAKEAEPVTEPGEAPESPEPAAEPAAPRAEAPAES